MLGKVIALETFIIYRSIRNKCLLALLFYTIHKIACTFLYRDVFAFEPVVQNCFKLFPFAMLYHQYGSVMLYHHCGVGQTNTQHTNKYLRFMQLIFLRNQLSSHTSLSLSLSLSLPPFLSTMKLNSAFALLVTMMAIESRRDVVASSSSLSSSSASDEADPPKTRKVCTAIIVSTFYILSLIIYVSRVRRQSYLILSFVSFVFLFRSLR